MEIGKIVVSRVDDVSCLSDFHCGVESMDAFIHSNLQDSIDNLYCKAYIVKIDNEIVAFFALSFDSIELLPQEVYNVVYRNDLTIDIIGNYNDIFLDKSSFPSIEIAYLAVRNDMRGKELGTCIIDIIREKALYQDFAGCQFLTVVPLNQVSYSAVGFYEKLGFVRKDNNAQKDGVYYSPLRIFKGCWEY